MSRFEFPANENGGAEIALQFGEVTVIRFGAEELAAKIEGRRTDGGREGEGEGEGGHQVCFFRATREESP